jgi:TonB family protein
MRLWLRAALLMMCASLLLASSPLSRAQQDQPETKRKIVTKIVPIYPGLARKMGITGSVKIEALVLPNGSVKSTETLGGHPVLAQSAVEAVRSCKWEPAPHESKEIIVFNFHPD